MFTGMIPERNQVKSKKTNLNTPFDPRLVAKKTVQPSEPRNISQIIGQQK